jgi:2-phosphosulfolactate phosphatase
MTVEDQPGFDPRLAWASEGGTLLARACPVVVVVDILRFTTTVEVAVTNGARVIPRPLPGSGSPAGPGAEAAALPDLGGRTDPGAAPGPGWRSLSPVSMAAVPAGTRVELASPNEATVSLAVAAARGNGAGRVPAQRLGRGPRRRGRIPGRRPDLPSALATCASGRELAARGLAGDLRPAAEHDVSQAVPRLSGGVFAQPS